MISHWVTTVYMLVGLYFLHPSLTKQSSACSAISKASIMPQSCAFSEVFCGDPKRG